MRLEWIILHPVTPNAALAIGLGFCIFLFLSLKRDLRAGDERCRKRLDALEADWQAKSALLEERWSELSQISNLLVAPAPTRSGLNLTKRSQALQMFRRGESVKEIAAALSLPQNEVDLLARVQRITLAQAAGL